MTSIVDRIQRANISGSQKWKGSAFAWNWEGWCMKMWKLGKIKNTVDLEYREVWLAGYVQKLSFVGLWIKFLLNIHHLPGITPNPLVSVNAFKLHHKYGLLIARISRTRNWGLERVTPLAGTPCSNYWDWHLELSGWVAATHMILLTGLPSHKCDNKEHPS